MKRLKLIFRQDMYCPDDRVIKYILKRQNTIEHVRKNPGNGVVMESIHTGNKRLFTHWGTLNIAGTERYEFINHDLRVKLLLDVSDEHSLYKH